MDTCKIDLSYSLLTNDEAILNTEIIKLMHSQRKSDVGGREYYIRD